MNCAGKIFAAIFVFGLISEGAHADQFHYRNFLIGERASGMGGAYTAISDDPTGVFYNPAGIVFGMENYFSASANSYARTDTRYKSIVTGQDYHLKSEEFIPTFFGFSQSIGRQKIACAVIVPDAEVVNQDDLLSNLSSTVGQTNIFRRKLMIEDKTYLIGAAYSAPLGDKASWGISLLGRIRLNKGIDNQLLQLNPVPTGKYYIQNTKVDESSFGLLPKLGVQYMPSNKLSLGLTVSKNINVSGTRKVQFIRTKLTSGGAVPTQDGVFSDDMEIVDQNSTSKVPVPWAVSAGAAYFFNPTLLITGSFDYYTADKTFSDFTVVSTYNWSMGAEWYATEAFAIRGGLFSDNANTPEVVSGGTNQPLHINLVGATLGFSLIKAGSSITLGGALSQGTGKGQALSGSTLIQEATLSNFTTYLAGSFQL